MRLFVIYFVLVSCCFAEGYGRYPSEWLGDPLGNAQYNSLGVGCAPSGVSGEAKADVYLPCNIGGDLQLRLLADTDSFALQNSSGGDTFTFSLDGDDRVMSFLGGTNTGTLTWDDSAAAMEFSTGVQTVDGAGISIGGEAPTTNAIMLGLCDDVTSQTAGANTAGIYYDGTYIWFKDGTSPTSYCGFIADIVSCNNVYAVQGIYGQDLTRSAKAPKGITYPEQTAPSAPSSGATLYTSSADGNLCAKRADGYQMCFGLPSFGKIFEENETGSAITVTVAGTYYPWITAEDGVGTGSTGGNTITTSTGNPSSITIEENGEGFYQVAWHAGIDTESGAVVHGAIFKNGSRILPTTNHVENATGATKDVAMSASTYVYLVENDVLTLQFTSDTNGDVVDVFHASLSCNRIAIEDNN